jgi:hypothetical protein
MTDEKLTPQDEEVIKKIEAISAIMNGSEMGDCMCMITTLMEMALHQQDEGERQSTCMIVNKIILKHLIGEEEM